jgi:hypothetical protein
LFVGGFVKAKVILLIILGLLLLASNIFAENGQFYFKFNVKSHDEVNKLTQVISIDNVQGLTVYAYANNQEFARFRALGYTYQILPDPGSLIIPRMSDQPSLLLDWDVYPTYPAYVALMDSFAMEYPDLCTIVNIGTTVQGRELLFAKISANVNQEENEPEVQYSSSMHGDETTGYVLMLRLIDYLLSNYGTDPEVTNILDHEEVWINPLANPDGTYHGGDNSVNSAIRYNANYVDLNRNFPDPAAGQHPDGNSWQPETIAMMTFFGQHSFTISANYHGGAEVFNYPWDTWQRRHPDDTWWINTGRAFADTVHSHSPSGYMDDLNNGITDGYDWYRVTGGRQDYMNYFKHGREATIEISSTKMPPSGQLPTYWGYLKNSFLQYFENALYGIRGMVTDAGSGLPLAAKIEVLNHDADSSDVRTDPQVGDYHRMIAPGTYSVRYSSPGYVTQTIEGIVANTRQTTTVDVQLVPISNNPALSYQGNDAGLVDRGDTVAMHITMINNGGGNANNVDAVLSTSDNYIIVLRDTSSYPDIPPLGGTGTSLSTYRFVVSPSCPFQHSTRFGLAITATGYSDSAFFDIMIAQQIEDFETGNFSSYPWHFSGNANWTISTTSPYHGQYCAKSGLIADNQSTELYILSNVTSPGTISFYYKVSSESGYDFLKFYIDGVQQAQWSGDLPWAQASFAVSSGNHTFKWGYYKDSSFSYGNDCSWIDFIVFPPLSAPLQILTDSLPDWTINRPYSQQLEAEGGIGILTWTDFYNNLNGTGLALSDSGLVSGVPTIAGDINFTARVTDESGTFVQLPYSFKINSALQITTTALPIGDVGLPYSIQLLAIGGTSPRIWADRDNDLNGSGLTLSSSGLLSGTPVAPDTINFTAIVSDIAGDTASSDFNLVILARGLSYIPGDINGNGIANGLDIIYLVNYFKGVGPAPYGIDCGSHGLLYAAADVNGNCSVNGLDVIYFVLFLKGGSPLMFCPDCPPTILDKQSGNVHRQNSRDSDK